MKDATNIKVFANAVKAKVEKANGMQTKTTWDTADHLRALAKAVATITDPEHDEAYVTLIEDVLKDGYNISQFAQVLATAYEKTGHFQRSARKTQTKSDLYVALGIE